MKAVITKKGSFRLNVPEGSVVHFTEGELNDFGVLAGGTALLQNGGTKIVGMFSVFPYCEDSIDEASAVEEAYVE